jgi:hypothetical protein
LNPSYAIKLLLYYIKCDETSLSINIVIVAIYALCSFAVSPFDGLNLSMHGLVKWPLINTSETINIVHTLHSIASADDPRLYVIDSSVKLCD